MNALVHYYGKSFGATYTSYDYGPQGYVATLSPHNSAGGMQLDVQFAEPAEGLGVSSAAGAKVTSFTLVLSKEEAVELAAALLTFACHPTEAGKQRKWMSLSSMPELDPKQFRRSIVLRPHSENGGSYEVKNRSDYHIAVITVEFSYVKDGDTSRFQVTKILNLPPGKTCDLGLTLGDFPDLNFNTVLIGQRIVSLTGMEGNRLENFYGERDGVSGGAT